MAGVMQTPVMNEADEAIARTLSMRGVRPPATVPGYDDYAFLGQGAYGEVWVAVNRNSGRKVAIKFYTRRSGVSWSNLAREVEKLRYLFSDRYVVQLFEVGWEAEPPYYVMEYMENGSLEEMLRATPLSVHEAAGLFREIAVALTHAHNKGILHCDLKPANILLDQDRRPRLADFGQSRLTNEMDPALGTLYYMAPEQADLNATPDARWDVYALGSVMYRMLTGEPPHYSEKRLPGANLKEQLESYRNLIQQAPKPDSHTKIRGVDRGLARIVDRCLEANPAKRYPSPHEVVAALDAWSLARVRRPLLLLSGIGFGLLLLAMTALGIYLFRDTVNTAEQEVINRTLEANQFAARAEAQQMALEIEHRWRVLEFAASDPELRQWLTAIEPPTEKIEHWLHGQREKYNPDFRLEAQASLWMALSQSGHMRGMDPPFPGQVGKYFGFRDYFTGAGHNSTEREGPPSRIIDAPYRSLVYRRQSTRSWAVTFSVPVLSTKAGAEPVGVLAMSVELKPEDITQSTNPHNRFSVLIDTRADGKSIEGLVVRHPYFAQLPADLPDEQVPLFHNERLVELARVQPFDPAGNSPHQSGWKLADLQDPVADKEFAGDWLAAAERVIVREGRANPKDSGFLVIVQERRENVLKPVAELRNRLSLGAIGAGLFLLVIVALIWAGTISVLDGAPKSRVTRLLRRWAGLPTGISGSSSVSASLGTADTGGAGERKSV